MSIGIQVTKPVNALLNQMRLSKAELLQLKALTKKEEYKTLIEVAKRLHQASVDAILQRIPSMSPERDYYYQGVSQKGIQDNDLYMNLGEHVENMLENLKRAETTRKVKPLRNVGMVKPKLTK